MTAPKYQADLSGVMDLLAGWIERSAGEDGVSWLKDRRDEIREGGAQWRFFTSFSGVPRFLGKADLKLQESDLVEADTIRSGWRPGRWSVDQAGRTLLILSYPGEDEKKFVDVLEQIFSTADVGESVALYQALPLFPYPVRFRARAAEGIRSSMSAIFNAVALDNPYPSEYFDEPAWNQLVLKAVFVGSPLHRIEGLDRRANAELARMLVDYAHERWAASRPVTPELWRPVGPFAEDSYHDELTRVLKSPDQANQEAAALALWSSGSRRAKALVPETLTGRLASGDLSWTSWVSSHGTDA